jgi:hypothetical protein
MSDNPACPVCDKIGKPRRATGLHVQLLWRNERTVKGSGGGLSRWLGHKPADEWTVQRCAAAPSCSGGAFSDPTPAQSPTHPCMWAG